MEAIIVSAPQPFSIAEETRLTEQTAQAAGTSLDSESEIKAAERYFKALREIEFLTLII